MGGKLCTTEIGKVFLQMTPKASFIISAPWHTPVGSMQSRQHQEDYFGWVQDHFGSCGKFQVSLNYRVRPCLTQNQTNLPIYNMNISIHKYYDYLKIIWI